MALEEVTFYFGRPRDILNDLVNLITRRTGKKSESPIHVIVVYFI